VAEPADTRHARGSRHRAKTDRTDARLIRELLPSGRLPESWIPPTDVLERRARVRLYKSLIDQRTQWCNASTPSCISTPVGARGGDPFRTDATSMPPCRVGGTPQ